jgi:phosphoribosylanthranilate isomerase
VTWIKICGTTSERDADIAIRAGANALGFVMAPSPRQVTDTMAYSIGTVAPKEVERIGVFVNEEAAVLAQMTRFCKFTGVQLHGEESAEYIVELRRLLPEVKILKSVTVEELAARMPASGCRFPPRVGENVPDRWLLDNRTAEKRGGTGETFDWCRAESLLRNPVRPVIVAGGLNAQNVRQALTMLRPWGVDVASGVESFPGRKHPGAVAQFIDAVRRFDDVANSAQASTTQKRDRT